MKKHSQLFRGALLVGMLWGGFLTCGHAQAPVLECDEVGANPDDFDRVADGVFWTVLDGNRAAAACRDALEKYPDEPRFVYQYGRALARLDRNDEAITYLTRAAEDGYLIGYTTLGGIYHFVTKNYAEAIKLYQEGAELGSASAQVHLGEMYSLGLGIRRDSRQALQWYTAAADQDYPLAHNKIADLYYNGNGVPKDYAKAAQYYRNAADLGLPRAQHAMGVMYGEGQGLARNVQAAQTWFTQSANQGFGASQIQVANLAEQSQNYEDAYFWYQIASRHREQEIRDDAVAGMTRLKKKLDRATRKSVRQRASTWRPVVVPSPKRQ